jgi:pilus assembly protein CpaE
MMNTAPQLAPAAVPLEMAEDHIAPAPRVAVQAFCETVETAAAVQSAAEDRRLAKTHFKVQMGGIIGAVQTFANSETPDVLIVEADGRADDLLVNLDRLAEVCETGTRLIVIGRINDVALFRELTSRGVSDYLVAAVRPLDVVRSICGLYRTANAKPVGRVIAVLGAKGGVGASTIAHNVAWSISHDFETETVVGDLDLPFGTAGLDYNQDPAQGIADAVFAPERIDSAYIERLLSKCTNHLNLLAAPATLDRLYDFGAEAFDSLVDVLRASMPCVVLDVPHVWCGWSRNVISKADEILLVATPDLPNLRNAKNILDFLRAARPNDRPPLFCFNQVGIPKRPEVPAAEFSKALQAQPVATIPFEPQLFGTAANNGQMIAEISPRHQTAETFRHMAQLLTGRARPQPRRQNVLTPFIYKLVKRSA